MTRFALELSMDVEDLAEVREYLAGLLAWLDEEGFMTVDLVRDGSKVGCMTVEEGP